MRLTIGKAAELRNVLARIRRAHEQLKLADSVEARGFGDQSHKRADAKAAIFEAGELLGAFIEANT